MQRLGADVIGESPSARRPRAEWRDVGMVRIERGERRNGLGGGEWRGPGGGKWGMRWRDSVGAGGSRRVSRAKRERRPGEVAAAGGAGGGPDRATAPSPPPDRSGIRQAVAPSPKFGR